MSNPHQLTTDEVELLREKVLENAADLLREAELLFSHASFARAYALGHLAAEELTKLPMLVRAAMEAELGQPVDWRKLDRRLRDHTEKLNAQHSFEYMFSEIRADDSDLTDYLDALNTTPKQNALKNASLYAGRFDGTVAGPKDIIDQSLAEQLLTKTRERYAFFEFTESKTRGAIKKMASDPSFTRFIKMLDQLRDGQGNA